MVLNLESLEKERAELIARNEEISRLKQQRKYNIVVPELVREFMQLETREAANRQRIAEIDQILNERN